ncbi:flotillin family protein [Microbispora triticiradicis]|uniref:Flotillin family protein n=3 Tax=Microbispora TaxID=2005 RepID=A0ABY3M616_9ACTN|nr:MULTISPECIES: SPFH domain-containing protein [Microbispora]RGA04189.1 flotillin family protein [Microbispora triticiradicis]TLP66348.1 flotillin family protein [Microbispora fusca]TYB68132.1 flotillin family protein [Microbispora tritici]GLW23841.1 flotillin family protein [Microbispora amethystogenes]
MPSEILVVGGVAIVALIVLTMLFKAIWRVAEPNEALIISGLGAHTRNELADSLGFKIVTGKGTAVLPGFQTSRRLRLDSRATNLQVNCVTQQGIPVQVRGVIIYKVGDDFTSIANAARRFLDQQDSMNGAIHELFTGHLRSIIGNLTVEDLILNRERLTSETRSSAADEMSKLGLVVDSLQIQEIEDETGYITNLGKPHAAKIAASARIAEAQRDQEATEAEQIAAANKAAAWRDAQIKQASYQAEIDEAQARSRQSGPLSEATARQEVVVQETRTAELEAQLSEQRLQSQVRKPADAKAYETVTLSQAERDARIAQAEAEAKETELRAVAQASQVKQAAAADAESVRLRGEAAAAATRATGLSEAEAAKARGLAEAEAAKARGLAEAEAIRARSEALRENQEAVIAQQLAENWPQIVEAGAKAFGNVDHMVVLNGAQGIEEMLAKALTLGGTGLGLARTLLAGGSPAAAQAAVQQDGASVNGAEPPTKNAVDAAS